MGKEKEPQEEGNIERNEKVDKRNEEEITEGKINEEREEKMDVEKEELPNQERKRKFRIVKRKKKKGNKKMMVERVQEMNRLIGDDEFNTRREKAEDEPALPLPAVVVSNHRNVSNVDLIKDESNTDDLVEDGVSGTVQVNLPMDIHMKSNVGTIQVDLPGGLCVKGGGAMSIGYKDNNLLEKQSNGTIQVGFPVGLCVKGGGVMSIGCNDNNLLEKQSNKSLDFLSTKPEILISDLLKSFSSLSSCEDEVRVNGSSSCINEENVEVKKKEERRGREKEGVGNESSNYINEENVEVKKREENRGREKEGVGNESSSCINEENVEVGEKEERRGREKEGVGSKNKGKNVYFPIFESSPFNSTDSSRLAMSVPNSPLIQKVSSNITSPLFSPSNRSDLPMSPLLDKSDLCAFPSRLSSPLGNTINFPLFPTNKTGEVVLKVFVQGESNEREFWNAIEQAYELTKDVLSSRETTLFTRAQTPTPSSSSRSSSSSFTPLFSLLPGTPHLLRSAAASPLTICDDAFDYKSILDNEAADYDVDANAKLSPYIFTPPSSLTTFSNNVNDSEMERNDMGGWRELEEGMDKKMDF
jgi:hypothetical protein